MPTKTVEIDELVYCFPERGVWGTRGGEHVFNFETFGLDPFRVEDVEIDIEEKFVYVRGDLEVEISWFDAEYEGETYREDERIESISSA